MKQINSQDSFFDLLSQTLQPKDSDVYSHDFLKGQKIKITPKWFEVNETFDLSSIKKGDPINVIYENIPLELQITVSRVDRKKRRIYVIAY